MDVVELNPVILSRHEVVRAKALELFANKGFGQVGMRELAKSLELSPGSFYNYYSGKQQLLFDLIEEFYEDLNLEVSVFYSGRGEGLKVYDLIKFHLDFYRAKFLHYKVAQRDLVFLSEDQKSVIRCLQKKYHVRLGRMLVRVCSGGKGELGVGVHVASIFMTNIAQWGSSNYSDESLCLVGEVMVCSALDASH